MEAATIRSMQQVGPTGQRADSGPSPQPPPPGMSYQQRVQTATAAQIHRTADTTQSYSKGGPSPSQSVPRSAASPLSPPRPGPGAAGAANYPSFGGAPAREAPLRYVQNSSYVPAFIRDASPFPRVSQVQQVVTEYRQVVPSSVIGAANVVPNSIQAPQPPQIVMQQIPQQVSQQTSTRPRISLLHPNPDYHLQTSRSVVSTVPDSTGPPAFKKIRLNEVVGSQHPPPVVGSVPLSVGSGNNATTLLKVDTRESPVVMVPSGAYHPQVEAISPTLPSDPMEELRATKDELLQQIAKVDNEIDKAEKKIASLKKKQESLEEASAKPPIEESSSEAQPKHRNLAQKIYAENRKRASAAHAVLSTLCSIGADSLPLYNQPSDAEVCREVQERHRMFKQRLLLHFRKIKTERAAKQCEITERYAQLSQEWTKRVDKLEASAKRKAKEAKNREFFEKVFPELRKQREDKERFNRVGSRIKSEADLEEIMDGLQEQAMEDKKMRSYAVIPPLMLDSRQRRLVFNNENGALIDMETEFKERLSLNVWTSGEKEIFREKFLQHSKNFGTIAASLDRKSAQDCVRYYYLSKKTENYKQLLRKSRQRTRSSRNPQKSNQQQTQSIVDAMTTGVTTRLQREQQQKTVGRDRAANSTNSTIGSNATSNVVNVTTNPSSNTVPASSNNGCGGNNINSSSSNNSVTNTNAINDVIGTGNNGSISGSCNTNSSSLSPSGYSVSASITAPTATSACGNNSNNTSSGSTTSSTTNMGSANESNVNSNGANVSNSVCATGGDSTEGSTKTNENELNASTGTTVVHTTTGTTAAVTTVTNVAASGDGSMNNDPATDSLSSKPSNSGKAVSGTGIISTTTTSSGKVEQTTAQPPVTGPANALSVENSIGVSYVIPSATIALSNIPINGVKPDLLSLNSTANQSLPSTVELTLGSVVASIVSSKLGSVKDDLQHLKEEINSSDSSNKRKDENINESSSADIQEDDEDELSYVSFAVLLILRAICERVVETKFRMVRKCNQVSYLLFWEYILKEN
uniref:SANT domain-containing protein n=1 Tax=Anopheles minimus TaxID=112268 RepID=A0A182WAS3_9DIPT